MTARQPRRPNGAPFRVLNVKVPPDVYAAFQAAADDNGETMSAAVVRFMRRYGRVHMKAGR